MNISLFQNSIFICPGPATHCAPDQSATQSGLPGSPLASPDINYRVLKRRTIRRNGQSLIELLIAIGAISAVLVAIVALSTRALSSQLFAHTEAQSTKLLQEQLERLRVYRDRSGYFGPTGLSALSCFVPTVASPCSATTCTISNAYVVSSGFTTTDGIAVCFGTAATCPGGKIEVTVMARWTDTKGTHAPTIKTCLTDWTR